jgi:bifunctional DNase/RNase
MQKIRLDIIGMSYSQSQSGAYALILGERDGKRRLPIIIGAFEAQAIAIELEKIKTPRPLTHDLFKSFADAFHLMVTEVIINKFKEGVFHAQLICTDGKVEMDVDSRTSDAIALALRFQCPIFTFEKIMAEAGIIMEEDSQVAATATGEAQEIPAMDGEYTSFELSDLKELLQKAVKNEEYEKASRIRDEINKRKKKE